MGLGSAWRPMADIIPAISLGAFRATPVGLELPKSKVPIERWLEYGAQLRVVQKALRWAIGDWLNYGNARYGEMYTQAYVYWPEYSIESLSNMKRVSAAIPMFRRRKSVSWSNHAEIASRPVNEQEQWLDELEMGMTRAELRLELKGETAMPFDWKKCAEELWGLLDDIDTYGDMYHPEITAYFKAVNKKAARRFEWLESDGYSLSPNGTLVDKGKMDVLAIK